MQRGSVKLFAWGWLFLGPYAAALAGLTLAPFFGDHAVLQRERRLPIWGTAGSGEKVTVNFRHQAVTTTAGRDGRWIVWLDPLPASAEPADLVVRAGETLVARDVVVGEVWLASGQSNMEFPVARLDEEERKFAMANLPLVRQLKVGRAVAPVPARDAQTSGWEMVSPQTVGTFSAVGYFFARELQEKLRIPVGIVNSSWGGTAIEAWMSDEARRGSPFAGAIEARWQKAVSEYPPEQLARYPAELAAWDAAEEVARANKTKNPLRWPPPPPAPDSPARPAGLFNAMIAPLQPMGLRGILWYQGESNARRAEEYADLFPATIRSWRAGWNDPELPFYFVQLPNFAMKDEPSGRKFAELREAQTRALELPHTGMAVAIDLGDPADIHPTRKRELGRRLAAIALAELFEVPVAWASPTFVSAIVEGTRMRVKFTHADGGLVTKSGAVQSLELAGPDREFYPATGEIQNDTLVVSSPDVPQPVAIRYAWTNSPVANLYNQAGLPVAPFRSDPW